jgi:hypothetical protein
MDELIRDAAGDVGKLEARLGFDRGHFGGGSGMVRVDIPNPLAHNARLPSGSESGANPHFRFGGYTDGGLPEAVLDPVPTSAAVVTFL